MSALRSANRPIAQALALGALIFTLFGLFTSPAGAAIDDEQLAEWGLATEGPSRTVAGFSSLGWALEEAGGVVWTGGKFLEVTDGSQTESQPFLAAFDRDTGAFVPTLRPDVGGPVLALERSPDGGLFVGGEMDTWDGDTIGALVKIDPTTGERWPGFNARIFGGTSVVRDLSLGSDGWMYAVGTFTTASSDGNPGPVQSVVRFDPVTGQIDWTWVPETDGGSVWGISRSYTQNTVYLVGWTNLRDGDFVLAIDATDPSVVVWNDFTLNFTCCRKMYDVQATPFGTVMVAGEQHGVYLYDENANWSQIIGHTTSYDSRHQNSAVRRGGDFQDIEMSPDGTTLYASCHCWGSHSTGIGFTPTYSFDLANVTGTHTGLVSATVAYDAVTGVRDQSFNPYMAGDSGGWGVLEASDGCVWIAGGINAVGPPGDQSPGRDLARLCDENYTPPNNLEPPVSCVATVTGANVEVSFPLVAGVPNYVVSRSVDGGPMYWRGLTSSSPFVDSNRSGTLAYQVQSRAANGDRSAAVACTTEDVTEPLEAPADCAAVIVGGTVQVGWPAAAGADEYVVYRTVDGGPQYWRGRVSTITFTDASRSGELVYFVASRSAAGELSARTECVTTNINDPVLPVDACAVVTLADGFTVSWDAAPGADASTEYVVYRTVDGGPQYWRGRVSTLTFDDSFRSGAIVYFVATRQDGELSSVAVCTEAAGVQG